MNWKTIIRYVAGLLCLGFGLWVTVDSENTRPDWLAIALVGGGLWVVAQPAIAALIDRAAQAWREYKCEK